MALIDFCVIDTDTLSYEERSVGTVLALADEAEKKQKYLETAEVCRASFTPFVQSVDGALGKETHYFLKRLVKNLSQMGKPYSEVISWVRTRMLFATIRATNLCLRGSR